MQVRFSLEGGCINIEKVKAKQVKVGDRISLDSINKPAFVVVGVESGHKIAGNVSAVRLTVKNDAGQGVAKNIGINKPLKREVR